tara:strand:- start:450012 stop:453299 length:3288 start_codon:yes stop_codon:yes gene_type:complete
MNLTSTFTKVSLFFIALFLILPLFINAQTTEPFLKRYENAGINGDLTIIGNSIVNNSANTPYDGSSNNNSFTMVYVDVDNDPSTFSSSSAELTLSNCDRVVYAGLYWGANLTTVAQTPQNIKFKTPGGVYQNISADIIDVSKRENLDLMYYKDVTSTVAALSNPSGDYFVADVSCDVGFSNRAAGWALVIVYESPTESRKYISTFDGFSQVSPNNSEQFSYSGFVTPPAPSPVEGRIGIAALEGDRSLSGEQLLFSEGTVPASDPNSSFDALWDAENPATNFFNSKITIDGAIVDTRDLDSENTLGWDIAIVDLTPLNPGNSILSNGATDATVRVATTGDRIFTFLNTFAVDIIEPNLQVLTSVEDTSNNPITLNSPVPLGATVWYNINFENEGTDNALNTVVLNTLPFNVTLDNTTFEFLDETGTPLAPGLITYVYNPGTRQITFTIDDSLVFKEGTSGSYNIRYQVTASANCFDYTDACTNLLQNFITSSYDGENSGQNVSDQPGLNGVNGCGLGNVGSMDLFVDTSSCQFDSVETFCNNTITISGHDGYNIYEWVDENGTAVGNTKEIDVDGPGVYTVTQTKVGCTITTRTVTVLGLDVTFTPTDAQCKDQADGKVAVQVNEASANFTYELFIGNALQQSSGVITTDNYQFNGLDIGTYRVRVTNAAGCYDTQIVVIEEPTLLEASNTVLDNIMPCNGNTLSGRIEVTGTGGTLDYEYSMDGGAFQTSNIFEATVGGNHIMTVRDAQGCTATTIANVTFDDEIVYTVEKQDVVCYGDSDGSISINVSQNNAGNTLTYSIDGGTTFQSSSNFTGLDKGDYEVIIRKVKGENSCETTESVTIDQLVFLELEVDTGFQCEGSENQIMASVAVQYENDVEYSLDGGPFQTSNIFEDVSDGEHSVRVRNITNGCIEPPVVVNVANYTPVSFEVLNNGNSLIEYIVNATDGEPEYQYALLKNVQENISPEVSDEDFGPSNILTVSGAGFYTFYVKDAKGCIVEQIVEIFDVEIPNFFTPNNDSINDTWYPRNIELYPDVEVTIFDRYQRLIASFKGNDKSWNGVYNGKLMPSGDYWYVVRLNHPQDNREFKGNVTLYR